MSEGREVVFSDRAAAGRALAVRLAELGLERPVVLALPRGGVPVAFEVAEALSAPLDLLLVRKIGAPGQPELAIGAVADGGAAETYVNEDLAREIGLPPGYLERETEAQLAEIERRRARYLGAAEAEPAPLGGRTAIVVDDGLATGATARAALRAVRRRHPARVILAVPVASRQAVQELSGEADEIVCLSTPVLFRALGFFYQDFRQLEDQEVIDLLRRARQRRSGTNPT